MLDRVCSFSDFNMLGMGNLRACSLWLLMDVGFVCGGGSATTLRLHHSFRCSTSIF